MTANLSGLNSFVNQFNHIEESLMDFLLESALRLGALTESRMLLLVEGKNGRRYCGHPDYIDAFKQGSFAHDPLGDEEIELDVTNSRASIRNRHRKRSGENDDSETTKECLKRKKCSSADDSKWDDEVEKKLRLSNGNEDTKKNEISTEHAGKRQPSSVNTEDCLSYENIEKTGVSTGLFAEVENGISPMMDDFISVKQETDPLFDFDSQSTSTTRNQTNLKSPEASFSIDSAKNVVGERLCLPNVKVMKEMEDFDSNRPPRTYPPMISGECIEPSYGGIPQQVFKHRCEICYQQSDCFVDGTVPKHTVKIIMPWCKEVVVVRHRGEQRYPCPDCERAAVSDGKAPSRNDDVRINSWENISSRLHTRLRQHYVRHHNCFLNQVYKTQEEVKEFYISARRIRCQMIHGPAYGKN